MFSMSVLDGTFQPFQPDSEYVRIQQQIKDAEEIGHRFIRLILRFTPRLPDHRITCVLCINTYRANVGNTGRFTIESYENYGDLVFRNDPALRKYVAFIWDDPRGHNRAFLVSHFSMNEWIIDDAAVLADVEHKAKILAAQIVDAPVANETPTPLTAEDSARMTIETLDKQIEHLTQRRAAMAKAQSQPEASATPEAGPEPTTQETPAPQTPASQASLAAPKKKAPAKKSGLVVNKGKGHDNQTARRAGKAASTVGS